MLIRGKLWQVIMTEQIWWWQSEGMSHLQSCIVPVQSSLNLKQWPVTCHSYTRGWVWFFLQSYLMPLVQSQWAWNLSWGCSSSSLPSGGAVWVSHTDTTPSVSPLSRYLPDLQVTAEYWSAFVWQLCGNDQPLETDCRKTGLTLMRSVHTASLGAQFWCFAR